MTLRKLGRTLAIGGFSLAVLVGAQTVSAQTWNGEYREWQEAQRRAQEEYRDYQRTRSMRAKLSGCRTSTQHVNLSERSNSALWADIESGNHNP